MRLAVRATPMGPLSRSVFTKTLNYLHGADPQDKRKAHHPRMVNTHPSTKPKKSTQPAKREESDEENQ
jgi:hypothetical protein